MTTVETKLSTVILARNTLLLIATLLWLFSNMIYAESNRFVHWWNQYVPTTNDKTRIGKYSGKYAIHVELEKPINIQIDGKKGIAVISKIPK